MTTRFVAEVCSNHFTADTVRGSAEHLARALLFVDRAAELGCAAVKFQQFEIQRLFAPEALHAHPELLARQRWELPREFNAALAARAREKGIAFASTPFYLDAVEELAPHVSFFKIASYQLLWNELLSAVARTQKPVVLATGMGTLEEVRAAVALLRREGCTDLTLLHCVSAYPTPASEANLAAIETLRKTFGVPAGWSDHTHDPEVLERAVRRFILRDASDHLAQQRVRFVARGGAPSSCRIHIGIASGTSGSRAIARGSCRWCRSCSMCSSGTLRSARSRSTVTPSGPRTTWRSVPQTDRAWRPWSASTTGWARPCS